MNSQNHILISDNDKFENSSKIITDYITSNDLVKTLKDKVNEPNENKIYLINPPNDYQNELKTILAENNENIIVLKENENNLDIDDDFYDKYYSENKLNNIINFKNYLNLNLLIFNLNQNNSFNIINNRFNQIQIKFSKFMNHNSEAYNLLKEYFIEILNYENIEKLLINLDNKNRKFFEKIIICDSLEEYNILNNMVENKKDFLKYKKLKTDLEKEYAKNKKLNEYLINSKSWKYTKFLRERSF